MWADCLFRRPFQRRLWWLSLLLALSCKQAVLPLAPSAHLPGDSPGIGFGYRLLVLPDFSADGNPDLAISAPQESRFALDGGAIRLYGNAAIDASSDPYLTIVGEQGERLGQGMSAACDLDGDGKTELLLAGATSRLALLASDSSADDPDSGMVRTRRYAVFPERFGAPEQILCPPAGSGGVSGDLSAVVVGFPHCSQDRGCLAIFHLPLDLSGERLQMESEIAVIEGAEAGAEFGFAVAFSGDATPDLAIGVPGMREQAGAVLTIPWQNLARLPKRGVFHPEELNGHWLFAGSATAGRLGHALVYARTQEAEPQEVLLAGAPGKDGDAGQLVFYLRSETGELSTAAQTALGYGAENDRCGTALAVLPAGSDTSGDSPAGPRIAAGCPGTVGFGSTSGSVSIFSLSPLGNLPMLPGGPEQDLAVPGQDPYPGEAHFGQSIAVEGYHVLIGAPAQRGSYGEGSGAVWRFARSAFTP